MQIHPLGHHVGAEIRGIDPTLPLASDEVTKLKQALAQYGVLVMRGIALEDATQIAFSRYFGPLEVFVKSELTDRAHPEIMEIADVGDTTKYLSVAQLWHTDGSYKATPSYITTLRALEICPEGGETWFANIAAGYDALPEEKKRAIEGLTVIHDIAYSRGLVPNLPPFSDKERAAVPAVTHPLVRTHSGTGRKTLYLGCHASGIVGMASEQGRALLQELEQWTTQPQFVYRHKWHHGDYVIWDNRGTMHRVTPYDASVYRRVMHRTEVSGRELPVAA